MVEAAKPSWPPSRVGVAFTGHLGDKELGHSPWLKAQ